MAKKNLSYNELDIACIKCMKHGCNSKAKELVDLKSRRTKDVYRVYLCRKHANPPKWKINLN